MVPCSFIPTLHWLLAANVRYIFPRFLTSRLARHGLSLFPPSMSSLLEKTRDLSKQLSKAAANSQLDDMIVLLKQLKEVVEPSEELIRVRVFF